MSYPCPNCNSTASPETGCPGCGRGPDADAAEVVRLDAEIAGLTTKLGYAQQAVRDLPPLIEGAWVRRNAAATRVRAARVPIPPVAAVRPVPVRGPEASTKLVQNLLFLFGGLLLAVAAIVFTAVAWAQFGVGGRAALLAFFTGAALAVPPVALRRKLSATAETFAAVGVLLVLLDGYAAWYVNLFGVAGGSPWGYAGAVCAVTAAVASGYEHVTGLIGPRFAALVVAQPVVPLLVVPAHPGATGWALAFAAVGALDVAVLALRFSGVGVAAYLCGAASVVISGCCALAGVIAADTPAAAAAAGGALLAPVLVVLVAAVLARNAVAQAVAGGLAVVALDVAGAGFALRVGSGSGLLRVAIVAFAVTVLAVGAGRLLLPVVARGLRAGALAALAAPVLAVVALVAEAAVSTLDAAGPFLAAGWGAAVPYVGRSLIVSILLLGGASVVVAPPSWRREVGLGAAVLIALALPAGLHLRWWSAPIFDLAVVVAALAIRYGGFFFGARIVVVALLGLHAVTAGFGRPGVAAGVLGAVALLGFATAVLARADPRRRDLGGAGLLTGLLAVPVVAWTTTAALTSAGATQSRVVLASVALLPAALWVTARRAPGYRPFAVAAVLGAVVTAPAWALASGDSVAVYAAVALLILAAAGLDGLVAALTGVPLGLALVAATGRSLFRVFLEPYQGWGLIGAGRPVGLPHVPVVDAVALVLVVFAAALVGYRRRVAGWTAAPALAVAVPVVLAAARAPWPTVAGVELALGLAGLLVAALRRTPVAIPLVGGLLAGSGLSGALPTHASTLGALGAVLIASAVAGSAARTQPIRVTGWLLTVAAAVGVAGTVGDALKLDLRVVAFLVLGVAAVAFAFSWVLVTWVPVRAAGGGDRAGEGQAIEAAAHAGAVLALLLSAESARGMAAVCILWGVALGIRALGVRAMSAPAPAGVDGPVSASVGGPVSAGVGGPVSAGVGGPVSAGVGGSVSGDAGGPVSAGAGGPASAGVGGSVSAGAGGSAPASGGGSVPGGPVSASAGGSVSADADGPVLVNSGGPVSVSAGGPVPASAGGRPIAAMRGARADGGGAGSAVRHGYVVAAAVAEFAGWCLLMAAANVSTVEVYTVPAAAVALLAGLLARGRMPRLSSWIAYGPALAAALLPSLATIAGADDQYLRRLLLGLAALAIVVAGANARLKAPVVMGGAALILVALHELAQVWDLIPRWIPLAAGGLLLVLLAMTLERRRRDLARFRAALTRMT